MGLLHVVVVSFVFLSSQITCQNSGTWCSPTVVVNPTQCNSTGSVISKDKCPDDFINFGGKCYFFGFIPLTWQDAKSMCESMSSQLVSIESYREDSFLTDQAQQWIRKFSSIAGFYTSGNDIKQEGSWVWESTMQIFTYSRWYPGQPNPDGDCLMMWKGHPPFWGWTDIPCSYKGGFICEM